MESFEDIWEQVRLYCKSTMSETLFKTWVLKMETPEFKDGTVYIKSTTQFRNDILKTQIDSYFRNALKDIIGFELPIEYIVEDESLSEEAPAEKDPTAKFSFDNFIVGSPNKLAHAAAWRIATAEPGTVYNPFFIYGNSGLGKTHLMLAIQNELRLRHKGIKIIYTTSENFLNEFTNCVMTRDMASFRNNYRNADALFIDDIQFIQNKEQTSEEFFHTFNHLINNGKQIILTSDRPPKEIEGIDERIRTRFESGLIADIQPPSVEMRIAIIRQKAKENSLKLSPQAVNLIAERITDNIRQIEGTIVKLSAMKVLYGVEPNIGSIQDTIRDIATDNRPVSTVVEEIIESIADRYDISKADIVSEKRNANITLARNVAMYVIREVTGLSLENIGAKFGGKKHSTVKHSIDIISDRMAADVKFKSSVNNIIKQFKK